LYNKCIKYVNNYLQIYEIRGTYYMENTLMSFHVPLIRNSCSFDSKLISSTIRIERFMFFAEVFLKCLVFWNVAFVFCWEVPDISKCRRGLLFRVKESTSKFLTHGSSMLVLLTIFWKHLAGESSHRKVDTYTRKYS
jgi:hypothetical protein